MNNSVRFFLKESGKVRLGVIDGHVTELNLFNSYWAFCMGAGGQKPVGAPKFRAMLRELGGELKFDMAISEAGMGSSQAIFKGLNMVL
jgi:putative DNA primase/helicase